MFVSLFEFHVIVVLKVQLTISQGWFWQKLDAIKQKTIIWANDDKDLRGNMT